MTESAEEHVLVVPTAVLHEAGLFHGFTPCVDHYLPRLLDPARLSYRARSAAEADPSFKQIIPYVVLRCGDRVFHYTRGRKGGEGRLHALRSVGVGGHICAADGAAEADPYRAGLLREMAEEVEIETPYRNRCVGLINDDRTPVGQVHIGVVHIFDFDEPHVRARDASLANGGFGALRELAAKKDEFETWSQFVFDALGEAT